MSLLFLKSLREELQKSMELSWKVNGDFAVPPSLSTSTPISTAGEGALKWSNSGFKS